MAALRAELRRLQQAIDAQAARWLEPGDRRLAPSVVTVFTPVGLGTGFVVKSEQGTSWVATNVHVVSPRSGSILRIETTLPALRLAYGTELEPQVGDPVLAYGSPQGLQGTATVGIISAIRTGWIQTDAQINQGNSGGPLVDRRGSVLGITSLAFVGGGSGLGFAVDARTLCPLLAGMTGCE